MVSAGKKFRMSLGGSSSGDAIIGSFSFSEWPVHHVLLGCPCDMAAGFP